MTGAGSRLVPERVQWAVELLAPEPGESVLEIGGGTGVSAGLFLDRLGGRTLLGLDRSPTADAAAARRHADAAGRGTFTEVMWTRGAPRATFKAIPPWT